MDQFLTALAGPKGVGHAYMDVGGRATQEQLPRMPGIIVIHIQQNGQGNLAKMAFPQYACMDAGGRVPKVGALGDAGAVTEIYPKSDRLPVYGWV